MTPRAGDRVRLIRHTDLFSKIKPGAEGTVSFIDGAGTIHVNWDSGSRLGIVVEAGDRIEVIGERTWDVVGVEPYIGPDLPGDREAVHICDDTCGHGEDDD